MVVSYVDSTFSLVWSVGHPLRLEGSLTLGIVSKKPWHQWQHIVGCSFDKTSASQFPSLILLGFRSCEVSVT